MHACLDLIPDDVERVYLAYSGGLDSSVLLHLLMHRPANYEIIAWHVNHGLQAAAQPMQDFCLAEAERYGVELRLDQLQLACLDRNIEAEARRQRYALFESALDERSCVLTAHHADDQAETFLLNALRGSGSAGLRGIARQRQLGGGLLLRPLLDYSREQLHEYADRAGIAWFDDPSNQERRFDRNYLRNEVMPGIAARWPHYASALGTAARLQGETQSLLDEIAAQDFKRLSRSDADTLPTLDRDETMELSEARQRNLLRYWVAEAGLASIPGARLDELVRQLSARADAMPMISLPGYSIRLYDGRLFLVEDGRGNAPSGIFDFDREPVIEINECQLRLARSEIFDRLQIEDGNQRLSIRFRRSGEGGGHSHRLKRLFQKHRVPPWRRDSVPQVYLDDELRGILQ